MKVKSKIRPILGYFALFKLIDSIMTLNYSDLSYHSNQKKYLAIIIATLLLLGLKLWDYLRKE
jgi:hypothetical protein